MTAIPALPSKSHGFEARLPYGKGDGRIFACRSKIYTSSFYDEGKRIPLSLNALKREGYQGRYLLYFDEGKSFISLYFTFSSSEYFIYPLIYRPENDSLYGYEF